MHMYGNVKGTMMVYSLHHSLITEYLLQFSVLFTPEALLLVSKFKKVVVRNSQIFTANLKEIHSIPDRIGKSLEAFIITWLGSLHCVVISKLVVL